MEILNSHALMQPLLTVKGILGVDRQEEMYSQAPPPSVRIGYWGDGTEVILENTPVRVDAVSTLPTFGSMVESLKGVSKGLVAEWMLSAMKGMELMPDCVLCVGDDRSGEQMFEVLSNPVAGLSLSEKAKVFVCTLWGQTPSKANYYLDDTT
ncbi:Alpha,alpha-trehalose-phosphate synthase [UDP-forming] 6 [Platanthera guangdongensis]|uniref:Alpha,alpha-trehalose-phosphate synthase [UDP-forming] 6 n=1 Tax=Platanthera guangdongensis TaxID=2320717 RepID=A0ABR2N379_9ASPA